MCDRRLSCQKRLRCSAASLAEVVTPPRDKRMLDEFESALRQDAAFVPASVDRRPDTMRVVLSFVQRVDVDERQF